MTTKQDDGTSKTEDMDVTVLSAAARKNYEDRGNKVEIRDAQEAAQTFCAALDEATPHTMLIAIAGYGEDDVLSSAATKNPNADAAVMLARQKALLTKAQNEKPTEG